jgi:glycosyltransferase involved in cell wall biosynthesis
VKLRGTDYAIVIASGALDRAWYFHQYPDVAEAAQDPVEHYLMYGWREGRDPSPRFCTASYLQDNPDVADAGEIPLVHYLTQGWREGRLPRRGARPVNNDDLLGSLCPLIVESAGVEQESVTFAPDVARAFTLLTKDHPATEPPGAEATRVVAFYLPQFHPIPENDEWWGQGFTEWDNVRRGQPVFEGHHQPHVPGELGHYDLRDPGVLQRQVELARLHGIAAFCFYAYWFHGKRLLERPLEDFLSRGDLTLEFCVCWANENWTRTWDGEEDAVLIAQEHSADDDLAFIEEMSRYLRDPRYFRVGGRPVLLVYRPSLLPTPAATVQRWRDWCRDAGIGEILLAYVQSFEAEDPRVYGFDYAVEFPPNNTGPRELQLPSSKPYAGRVYDWKELAERSHRYSPPTYPTWRGACPSWDNEARRPGRGAVLWGSTPERFREWLVNAARDTRERISAPDERVLFVNAWNEWAEGAHLEPDEEHGYQWLHAVRDMHELVGGVRRGTGPGVVVVTHDLHKHGAQMLALNWVKELTRLGRRVEVVALGEGEMRADFEALCPVTHLSDLDSGPAAQQVADDLAARGFSTAICNTSVSGYFASVLRLAGIYCVGFVHEMSSVLQSPFVRTRADALAVASHELYFASREVADDFPFEAQGEVKIRPQGLYLTPSVADSGGRRGTVRGALGIPASAVVVLGVGFGDRRKGLDLFAEACSRASGLTRDLHFVWVGEPDRYDQDIVDALDRFASPKLHLVGFATDPRPYYEEADVLALSSREDPFPSVTLEAMTHGLPCVAFRGATGQEKLITDEGGALAEQVDAASLLGALSHLLDRIDDRADPKERSARATRLSNEFNFRRYVMDVLASTPAALPRVSVVLPNFEYADLVTSRVQQVLHQTRPVYELIVLDDASSDNSVEALGNALRGAPCAVTLLVNEINSGSVFAQWRRGADLASGDLVWIAEADDVADPSFCERMAAEFRDNSVVLAYCQSRQIGPDGIQLAPDYLEYVGDITGRDWRRRYRSEGLDEIRDCLSIKNSIPNVSAVMFRRTALTEALARFTPELQAALPTAGDWWVYLQALAHGACVYQPVALNDHRRHPDSVVARNLGEQHLREIAFLQGLARQSVDTTPDQDAAAEAWLRAVASQFDIELPRHA